MAANIVGFCRFSFFGRSDTKLSYDDRQRAFDTLYAPERMETRFALFSRLLLPAVRAQTDPDFRLVIVSSAVMPQTWRDRLAALCADVPQIELHFAETEELWRVLLPHTRDKAHRGGGLLQFRIDDDDALSVRFIERLRRWGPVMGHRMLLTMPAGLMVYRSQRGAVCQRLYRNLTGAGLAFYTQGPTRKNIYGFAHLKAGQRLPYLSDPTICSHIQTFTGSSDTSFRAERKIRQFVRQTHVAAAEQEERAAIDAMLAEDFPYLTRDGLIEAFTAAESAGAQDRRTA